MVHIEFIQLLRKYQVFLLVLLCIAVLYFFLRLYNLTSLPLFIDEVTYIRWGTLAQIDATQRFISLTDGKQPLFVWLLWPSVKVFSDPVVAGRMVSVLTGFISLVGIFFLTTILFRKKIVGVIAGFLYVVIPMTLLYDRLALYESLVSALTVWGLIGIVLLVRFLRLDIAILLGYILGLGLLTKSSMQLLIIMSPIGIILSQSFSKRKLVTVIGLLSVSFGIAALMYQIMNLSPFLHIVSQKNNIFVYTFYDIYTLEAVKSWIPNFFNLSRWFITYLTFPLFLMGIFSFITTREFMREKIFLLAMSLLPFLGLLVFGRLINPRYILFMVVAFIPLSAYCIYFIYSNAKNRILFWLIMLFVILPSLFLDTLILTDFKNAPVPHEDSFQIAHSFASGYGMKEVVNFINDESQKQTVYLATEGKYGSLPTTYAQLYLESNHEVVRVPLDHPTSKDFPEELVLASEKHPVYVVLNIDQTPPTNWPLRLVQEYQKGKSKYFLRLYQVDKALFRSEK